MTIKWYIHLMSGTYTVLMGDRGRIVVPSEVRHRTGLAEGTPMVLVDAADGLVLLTRDQLTERVRQNLACTDLVAELLSARRDEAAREDAA